MEDGSEELLSGYKWTGSEPEEIATYLQWESQPKKPLSVHRKQPPGKTVQIWETQTNGDSRVWDVIVATCDDEGAGTDASAYLKIYYEAGHDSQTFMMDKPGRDDFEQGSRDHFRLMLKQSDIVNMGLYWWPGFSLSQSWCVDWVLLLNAETETCYEAMFNKWILHYSDPPTYASRFHRLSFSECVSPGRPGAPRSRFIRFDDKKSAFT